MPLQDYPNHLARAVALSDLLFGHGARFAAQFTVQLAPVPYVLGDLLLAVLVRVFGVAGGAAAFTTVVLLSLPAALLLWVRMVRLPGACAPLLFLLALYPSTDWFFLMGFLSFRLGLALLLAALALAEGYRAGGGPGLMIGYGLALVCAWLTHLSALVFFLPVMGVWSGWRLMTGVSPWRTEARLWVVPLALTLVHFGLVAPLTAPASAPYGYEWGDWAQKLAGLQFEFRRYAGRLATPLLLLFGACVLWPILPALRTRVLAAPRLVASLLTAAAFVLVYCVLPRQLPVATYVDLRALPVIALFVLLGAVELTRVPAAAARCAAPATLLAAAVLAAANLAYVATRLESGERWLERYRAVAAVVPEGARVLPVYTLPTTSLLLPGLHAGSFLVIDRAAVMPYLFAGDRGDPMWYFRYRARPYAPDERWYSAQLRRHEADGERAAASAQGSAALAAWTRREQASARGERWYRDVGAVDWRRVACSYRFLLVTRPYDAQLIALHTDLVAGNATAALLAVRPGSCAARESAAGAQDGMASRRRSRRAPASCR